MVGTVELVFLRSDEIEVRYQITLVNIYDRNENFTILKVSAINTPIERRLFYQFDKRNWTLNEFIYFAENNDMCIVINNISNNTMVNYGACSLLTGRIFGLQFNHKFN